MANSNAAATGGVARRPQAFFAEMRNVVFAKVAQGTIRSVATQTFGHLHALDLQVIPKMLCPGYL